VKKSAKEMYEQGRVPAEPVRRRALAYMNEHDISVQLFAYGIARVSPKIFSGEQQPEWIDFDSADRMLCRMNDVFAWYSPELAEAYQKVSLRRRVKKKPTNRCLRPGCSKVFEPRPHTPRGRQKYCSERCRKAVADARQGRVGYPNELRIHSKFECTHGHERGPDNPPGKECRECRKERNRRYYRENRERLLKKEAERYRERSAA
jgi:hypothetical protein